MVSPMVNPAASANNYTGVDNLEVMLEAENYNRWLCDLVTGYARPGDTLIDFGAGSGTFARATQERGYAVTCVEPDLPLRTMLTASGMSAIASLEDIPAGSAPFIYTLNVLEHIEDDLGACRQLAQRLCSGGTLLIYVPAFQSLYSSMDRKVGHHRRYRLGPLVNMVESCGLKVRSARYADSLGFLASMAYKLIGANDGSINPRTIRFYDRMLFPLSRALDIPFGKLMGKNALVVATRP